MNVGWAFVVPVTWLARSSNYYRDSPRSILCRYFIFSGCGCISCPVDCSPEVLRRLKEFFWFADFEHYNLQLVHLGSGRRRILTHLDIDDVKSFKMF